MADATQYPPVAPYLSVDDGRAALAFYARAFAAEPVGEVVEWKGKIGHAQLRTNGGDVMLSDWSQEFTEMIGVTPPARLGGSSVIVNLGVDDVDAWFTCAVEAGAVAVNAPADEFYGRHAKVRDPFGHVFAFVSRPPAA